jgi:hypothetical protein
MIVCAHHVFVTSNNYPGDFNKNDPNAGDAICTAEAKAASMPMIKWKAVLSDTVTPANKRITVTGNVCLANDGVKKPSTAVVSDAAAWWLGPHKLPINRTAAGTLGTSMFNFVWTGSKIDGSASGADCAAWKNSAAATGGTAGSFTSVGQAWLDASPGQGCLANYALYCISQQ